MLHINITINAITLLELFGVVIFVIAVIKLAALAPPNDEVCDDPDFIQHHASCPECGTDNNLTMRRQGMAYEGEVNCVRCHHPFEVMTVK